jgi:hypothetical protein
MTHPINCPNPTRTQVFRGKEQLDRFFDNVGVCFHKATPQDPAFPEGPFLVEYCLGSAAPTGKERTGP